MTQLGADPDALEALARSFRQHAGQIDGIERQLAQACLQAWWYGIGADQFRRTWTTSDSIVLREIRQQLEQLGEQLGRQAEQQRLASRDDLASAPVAPRGSDRSSDQAVAGRGPIAISRRAFLSGDRASVPFLSASNATEVEVAEMDDGTFRIKIAGTYDGSLGIGIAKILGTGDLADLGLSVSAGDGFEVELQAPDAASAAAIEDALRGRTESLTNWTVFAGVSSEEAISASRGEGAEVISVTGRGLASGVEAPASLIGQGFLADQQGHDETTIDLKTGHRIDRTIVDSDLSGTGWNEDGVSERHMVEIVRDPATGEAFRARFVHEQGSYTDLRTGASKAWDLTAGLVTWGNHNDSAGAVDLAVTTYEFDLLSLAEDDPIRAAAQEDDRGTISRLASSRSATGTVEEYRYEGTAHSSDRGMGLLSFGGARTRGGTELTLVSHTRDG